MEHFPRHWDVAEDRVQDPAGRTFRLRIWGWSTSSAGQAAIAARRRLAEVVQKVRSGQPLGEGYYHRNPPREEVLREIRTPEGDLIGLITRNSYGAQILNTDRILIADVDDPARQARRREGGLLSRLFRRGRPEPQAQEEDDPVLSRIEQFARERTHLGVHVYQTAAGFRVLITGVHTPPDSEYATEILAALASDPLYARLCAVHRNYRARLTPKPWRSGMRSLALQWPWADAQVEQEAAKWVDRYEQRTADYAVCRLIRRGDTAPSPAEAQVLQVHDEYVLGPADRPLA